MLFSKLIKELTAAKHDLESLVATGGVHNYETYRFFIGRIHGLKDAIDICQNLIKGKTEDE